MQPARATNATVVLRQSRTTAFVLAAFLLVSSGAMALFLTAQIPGFTGPRAFAVVMMVPAVLAALLVVTAWRHVIRIGPTAVTSRGLLFTRSAPCAAVATAVTVRHHGDEGDRRTLHLLDRAGYTVLSIDSQVWSPAQHRQVAAALGLPAGAYLEVEARDFREQRR